MANDTMSKHVSKDPQGYVPVPVIASMKKIKALVSDPHLLVQALRSSSKLVVSKDNKRVKRISPFTENYKDHLQVPICKIVQHCLEMRFCKVHHNNSALMQSLFCSLEL